MPIVPQSTITGRIGVFYTGYISSLAGLLFREMPPPDVGIDGLLELVDENEKATGLLAGLQIKSGDSFVNIKTKVFSLKAEPKSFEYWSRFNLPVIGVVYSPSLNKAVWFDLTTQSRKRINELFKVSEKINEINEFSVGNIKNHIVRIIKSAHSFPISTQNIETIANNIENTDGIEITKELAWKRLTSAFLNINNVPEVVADAGYRISWYFSGVNKKQKDFFKRKIASITDKQLLSIITSINQALIDDRDDVANYICELLVYLPDNEIRMQNLISNGLVEPELIETFEQVVDVLRQL